MIGELAYEGLFYVEKDKTGNLLFAGIEMVTLAIFVVFVVVLLLNSSLDWLRMKSNTFGSGQSSSICARRLSRLRSWNLPGPEMFQGFSPEKVDAHAAKERSITTASTGSLHSNLAEGAAADAS